MESTTNYHLKKWDAHDRVLRQDFNSNWDQIDRVIAAESASRQSAIAELRSQSSFVKLQDLTITEAQHNLQLDLSSIDWSTWQVIRIDLFLFSNQGGSADVTLNNGGRHVSILGGSGDTPFLNAEILPKTSSSQPAPGRIFLLPMGEPAQYVRALSFGRTGLCYSYLDTAYQALTRLGLSTTGSAFLPGCRMAIWGMR